MILYEEMRDIIVQIDNLRDGIQSDDFSPAIYSEGHIFGGGVSNWISDIFLDLFFIQSFR